MIIEVVHVTDLKHQVLNGIAGQELTETESIKISLLNSFQSTFKEVFLNIN